ncbi:hypothetical protein AGOR_G00030130 [Albula goreensis]|uniref:Uncharacterized protein n=1 Tax=Albula goreensis TaxID=1534307 RepID=A0A8T3E4X9_9TELE|nr:hypothetical protein AGOR_G00030130 [Albula goreensis]
MGMTLLTVTVAVGLLIRGIVGQSSAETSVPVLTPSDFVGKVTSNTVILRPPMCYFNNITSLNCTSDSCDIYLVPAIDSGISNFEADKTNSSILSQSPYPTAFSSPTSKNYYLTKVGPPDGFTCRTVPDLSYFRVGSDGKCSEPNCNGILPTGSTVRFKYALLSMPNGTVLQETNWSSPITLISPKSPAAIDDSFAGRSAAMVVITTILSVAMFLLLLLLIIFLICKGCCNKPEPMPVLGSLRVRKYDTHNLRDPEQHVNPAFEGDLKKFSSFAPEVLEHVPTPATDSELSDSVTLKRYKNNDLSQEGSKTS